MYRSEEPVMHVWGLLMRSVNVYIEKIIAVFLWSSIGTWLIIFEFADKMERNFLETYKEMFSRMSFINISYKEKKTINLTIH